jgi:hypothetical protein
MCAHYALVLALFIALTTQLITPSPTDAGTAPTIATGAPTVPTDAPTVPTDAPTVVTGAPTVITGAPTVPTDAPTVVTGAPTVTTGAPTVPTGAPTVITGAPTVPTGAPTVVTGAPTVITGAPTVITGAPTVITGAPTVVTGAPTVITGAPTVITGAPTVITGAPTVPTDAPTIITPPLSVCRALKNCVKPLLDCIYATYEEGSEGINLMLGYNNTAREDIPYSEIDSVINTDGEVVSLFDYSYFNVSRTFFVILVKNATYLNWTLGVNEFVWTTGDTPTDGNFSCNAFPLGCGFVGLPDYCQDFSFCSRDTCVNDRCVSTPRCNTSSELPLCDEVTFTCDALLVSEPGPNTGSPSLENSPLSLPIVIIPSVAVIIAAVAIYVFRTGIRPSRRL